MTWRRAVFPWANAAALVAPDADVHHGHDVTGLVGRGRRCERDARAGRLRQPRALHGIGRHARQGRLARFWLRSLERRLARRAVALVTVNATLEEILRRNLGFTRSVVVHNAPPRWTPPDPAPDLLRERLGLPPEARIALYHGGLAAGPGPSPARRCRPRARHGGRPPRVPRLRTPSRRARRSAQPIPDPAGASTSSMLFRPTSWPPGSPPPTSASCPTSRHANERLSTPNKLFESMAVGLPVVSSDFPERRRIILGDPEGPLGAVCDPTSPEAIATAIRSVVDLRAGRARGLAQPDPAGGPRALELGDRERPPRRPLRGTGGGAPVVMGRQSVRGRMRDMQCAPPVPPLAVGLMTAWTLVVAGRR